MDTAHAAPTPDTALEADRSGTVRKLRRSLVAASAVNVMVAAALLAGGLPMHWGAVSTYLVVVGLGAHVAATLAGWRALASATPQTEKAAGRAAAGRLLGADVLLYAGLVTALLGSVLARR